MTVAGAAAGEQLAAAPEGVPAVVSVREVVQEVVVEAVLRAVDGEGEAASPAPAARGAARRWWSNRTAMRACS